MSRTAEFGTTLPKVLEEAPVLRLTDRFLLPHNLLPLQFSGRKRVQLLQSASKQGGWLAVAVAGDDSVLADSVSRAVCIARVEVCQPIESARVVVILRGVSRGYVLADFEGCSGGREADDGPPHWYARIEARPDFYARHPVIDRVHRAHELIALFRQLLSETIGVPFLYQFTMENLPLGELCDLMAPALVLDRSTRRELLAECDVDLRSDRVLELLRGQLRQLRAGRSIQISPPLFSAN
ncbi:MAG: hypothetical protein GXP27_02490 [Planctomycetes bacterium]|nr:hypothetical protein [Planctomycetota bacterium]